MAMVSQFAVRSSSGLIELSVELVRRIHRVGVDTEQVRVKQVSS
jgi:hypothetical protein